MFSLQQQVNAQLVPPALSQQFLAPATPLSSFADDITVNCDMLSTANGLPIRAIVWDDGSEATYGLGIGQVHVYLQDYASHTYKFDFQGAQFKTTDVEDIANGETGKVYPNPATDYIRLSETGNYKIYDMQGRLVMNGEKKAATETIGVYRLPAGTYMLRLQTETGNDNYTFVKQ